MEKKELGLFVSCCLRPAGGLESKLHGCLPHSGVRWHTGPGDPDQLCGFGGDNAGCPPKM